MPVASTICTVLCAAHLGAAVAQETEGEPVRGDDLAALLEELGCERGAQELRAEFVDRGGTPDEFEAEAVALVAQGRLEEVEDGEDGAVMRLTGGEECED